MPSMMPSPSGANPMPVSMVGGPMPMPPMGGSANNPTGTQGGGVTGGGSPILGASPLPVLPRGVTPSPLGATPGPIPAPATPGQSTATNTATTPLSPGSAIDTSELDSIYGAGVGNYISQLMSNGGMNMGLLNQVNSSELNSMQGPINQGAANLNSTLGAMGVSANSSTAGLANSQYQQGATAQENSQIAQNYMNEFDEGQSTLQSILGGVTGQSANYEANQNNWMDYLGFGAQMGSSAIGDALMIGMM